MHFQDCIITALRSGNKECPTCRKKLVSKRSLRPDPNFDTLISKIYPSRDEYEQHQERVLAKLNKSHNHASLINSIEEGIKLQSQSRSKPRKGAQEEGGGGSTVAPSSAPSTPTPGETNPSTTTGVPSSGTSTNPTSSSSALSTSSGSPSSVGPKPKKFKTAVVTSENESGAGSGIENAGDEGEGPSDSSTSEIELVFRPHPLEMNEENELIRELKDSSIRYIKTTANATGKSFKYSNDLIPVFH